MINHLHFVLTAAYIVVTTAERSDRILEKYDQLMYHDRVPIAQGHNATEVSVSIHVLRMYSFDEEDKSFNVDMYLRQKWMDDRLEYSARNESDIITGGRELVDRLWTPDTFFTYGHLDNSHPVPSPNIFVRIKPNGEVYVVGKYTTNVPCVEVEEKYEQLECVLGIESFGYSTDFITYKWSSHVTYEKFIRLGQHKLVAVHSKSTVYPNSQAKYSGLRAFLRLGKKNVKA